MEITYNEQPNFDPWVLFDTLAKTEKNKVKQCISNVVKVLENDPAFSDKIMFNEMTERVEIVGPMKWKRKSPALTDTDMNYICMYLDDHYSLVRESIISSGIDVVADKHKFHPIRDYLNSLEWDGTERVRYALNRFLGADTSDLTYESLKLFMLGAVERVFHPGCKFELMLCLVGGQGAGKSTFFRFLAINDDWYSDDIRKLDDDNVYRKLQGHWIMEMSEMIATANAKSIEDIKAFISRQKETYKIPYQVYPEDRPRQCVFAGTSNKKQFLPGDKTGNRRFLPVGCNASMAQIHILDDENESRAYIEQMWAEIMAIYKNGNYKLCLSKEMNEQMQQYQQKFVPEDSDEDAILGWLEETTEKYVCTKMIYYEALGHDEHETPKRWELNAINEIMILLADGWEQGPQHRFNIYGQQRAWVRISGNNETGCENSNDDFVPIPDYIQEEIPFR